MSEDSFTLLYKAAPSVSYVLVTAEMVRALVANYGYSFVASGLTREQAKVIRLLRESGGAHDGRP